MNKTHTPGPWRVEGDSLVVAGRYGLHIASVSTTGMGHAVLPNAKLIAASPALLAALVRVNEDLKDTFGYDSENGLHNRSLARTQKIVEEAINLATGKEG